MLNFRSQGEARWDEFEGNCTLEASVFGFVDNTHPAFAQALENSVVGNYVTNE